MLIKKIFYQELVSNAIKILTVLVFILPITELFKLLEGTGGSGGLPTNTLIAFVLYGTIASFPMILTISCFLTVVITINRYCKDHEFAVWLASGVSPFFWLKLVSKFAIPLALLCAISTMYVTPWATGKKNQYTEFLSRQKTNVMITPGVFRENGNGRDIFYLDHYSLLTGYARDIFVQYTEQTGITYNITAYEGKLTNDSGVSSLTLKNARRYQLVPEANAAYSKIDLSFAELRASIRQDMHPAALNNQSIDSSSLKKLLDSVNSKNDNHAKAELSWRISIAVMLFVMNFLAVPISIQTGRVQGSIVFVLPPIIYAVYNNLVLTLNGYINQGVLSSMIFVQLLHLLLIIIGILLTYYKCYPKGYWSVKRKFKQ